MGKTATARASGHGRTCGHMDTTLVQCPLRGVASAHLRTGTLWWYQMCGRQTKFLGITERSGECRRLSSGAPDIYLLCKSFFVSRILDRFHGVIPWKQYGSNPYREPVANGAHYCSRKSRKNDLFYFAARPDCRSYQSRFVQPFRIASRADRLANREARASLALQSRERQSAERPARRPVARRS